MIFKRRTKIYERWYFRHSKAYKIKGCDYVVKRNSHCLLFVMSDNLDIHYREVWSVLADQFVLEDPGFSLIVDYILSTKKILACWLNEMKPKRLAILVIYNCMIHFTLPMGEWMQTEN